MVDVNKIFDKLGWWHVPVFLLVTFRSWPMGLNVLFLSFAASPKQDHWCARPERLTEVLTVQEWKELAIPLIDGKYSRCSVRKFIEGNGTLQFLDETEKCTDWEFDTTYYDWTLVREFGMVCEKSWYVSASQSAFMGGLMVGNVVFAKIADKFGRRTALQWATVVMLGSSLVTVFCRNFVAFSVARFVTSVTTGAYQCCVVSILMECLSARKRSWAMLQSLGWNTGNLLPPLVAYLLRNWVHQQILFAIAPLPVLVVLFFVPESPRWLLASGREEKAEKALANVVKMNKIDDVDLDAMFAEHRQQKGVENSGTPTKSQPSYMDLLRGPNMRRRAICIWIIYFSSRLLMFHLKFFSTRMSGDPFLAYSLISLLAIPADIFAAFFIRHVRRRRTLSVLFTGAGIFILTLMYFQDVSFTTRIILCVLAKWTISMGSSILGVFASESFPTVIRAMGIGSAYTMSRLGAMLAPFFKELEDAGGRGVAAFVSAAVALIGAFCALLLPETLNKSLPDSLADVDPDVYAPIPMEAKGGDRQENHKNA